MTVKIDIITLGFFILAIILAAFLMPMIWQFKKTAQEADAFLGELRRELSPILRDLRETTTRINQSSQKFEKGSIKAENLLDSLEDIAISIRHISSYVESAGYVILGIKAATKVFFQGIKDKETNS